MHNVTHSLSISLLFTTIVSLPFLFPTPTSLAQRTSSLSLSLSLHFLCQTFFSSLSLSSHLLFLPRLFPRIGLVEERHFFGHTLGSAESSFYFKVRFREFPVENQKRPSHFFSDQHFCKNRVKKNRPQWLLSFSSFLVHFAAADHEKKPFGFASRVEKYFSLSFFWITSYSFRFSVNLKL